MTHDEIAEASEVEEHDDLDDEEHAEEGRDVDVFISYRLNPDAPKASAFKRLLQSALVPTPNVFVSGDGGLRPSNVALKPQLHAAIRVAHAVVAIITPASKDREWVNFEAGADLASSWTPISPACGQSDRHHADTEIAVADSELGATRTAGSPSCGHLDRSFGQPDRRRVDTGIGCADSQIAA